MSAVAMDKWAGRVVLCIAWLARALERGFDVLGRHGRLW